MTESANFRQNLQNVPSIFEISAAETLDNLIYPALSKIFDHVGRLDFRLWGQWRFGEELSPLVTWLLQHLYLRHRGSSFGESFYGLQRTDTVTGAPMTHAQQWASSALLTLLPYCERKLRQRHAQSETNGRWERHILNVFNAYHASKAVQTFLYLVKSTSSHSPIFSGLRLTLRYPTEPPGEDKTTYFFLKLLEIFAFFLQFIQWWYSDEQSRKLGGTLKTPPPMRDEPSKDKGAVELPPGKCPVCLMALTTPTACVVTGYVFCWQCIVTHVKRSPFCPITGHAISLEDLTRLYEA